MTPDIASKAATPSAGVFDGLDHLLPIRVYYEDTDFTGVVYHANYVRYFERGRSDFLRLAGVSHADMFAGDLPLAFAVVRMEIDFARAAAIDDALTVRTRFSDLRGPRFFIDQTILRGEERIAHASVQVAVVGGGRPRKPSPRLIAQLAPWIAQTPAHDAP
jgi:acyl-CoA thioester hydrolase